MPRMLRLKFSSYMNLSEFPTQVAANGLPIRTGLDQWAAGLVYMYQLMRRLCEFYYSFISMQKLIKKQR